jgi:pseudouridine-5'-phosphate glycosidase
LGLSSGTLLACPLPEGDLAIGASIEEAVQKALTEAEKKQIQGKDVTPFVLARVSQLSGNESLRLSQLFKSNQNQKFSLC